MWTHCIIRNFVNFLQCLGFTLRPRRNCTSIRAWLVWQPLFSITLEAAELSVSVQVNIYYVDLSLRGSNNTLSNAIPTYPTPAIPNYHIGCWCLHCTLCTFGLITTMFIPNPILYCSCCIIVNQFENDQVTFIHYQKYVPVLFFNFWVWHQNIYVISYIERYHYF